MEDLILNLGEGITLTGEDSMYLYLIPLTRVVNSGSYVIGCSITTKTGETYILNFNGDEKTIETQFYGLTYFLDISEPTEIYLKLDREMLLSSFIVSINRTG